jgi:hypothetical protein
VDVIRPLWLAGDGKINMVMLVMAHPWLAFHKLQILADVRPAWCRKQARLKSRIENDQLDAYAVRFDGRIKPNRWNSLSSNNKPKRSGAFRVIAWENASSSSVGV